ncbi:TIGR00645 family protein [soil metagenome]
MTLNKQTPDSIPLFSLDGAMYQARWLLYPINCGLLIALSIYVAKFLWHIAVLVLSAPQLIIGGDQHNELMLVIVGLLDQAMISALLILTIMGGHQIYVRRFKFQKKEDSPQWLDHIDTIMLKVKLGLAFVGVSSVLLLEDAIRATAVPREVWILHLILHIAFLATTLIVAVVWRIMRAPLGKA